MPNRHHLLSFILAALFGVGIQTMAQTITGTDPMGNLTQIDENGSRRGNFNPHNNDTTRKNKVVPKGIYVWNVDRKLGDIERAIVDTVPHLYPQTTLASGKYKEYNTLGSNYTARLSRIFIDRPEQEHYFFLQPYNQIINGPEHWQFTNTLSPITNLSYDNCGNKQDGEDHIKARFAVNAGKRTGIGFDLDYAYARGYFQNQATSHFLGTVYGSHLGDQYQMHVLYSHYHQKASENGGITNDNYITHPELFADSYSDNEIPSVLQQNWNRNDGDRLFLTHRYSLGFYREVKMTEEEIKARKFAKEANKEKKTKGDKNRKRNENDEEKAPLGRPEGAEVKAMPKEAIDLKKDSLLTESDSLLADSLHIALADSLGSDSLMANNGRIKVTSKEQADSLIKAKEMADSLAELMKKEFVPVTSFIHTLDVENYEHIYQAYQTPSNYYSNTYYRVGPNGAAGDSIYDQTKYLMVRNTLGFALLEGFNKWMKAGIKLFGTHELRRFDLPQIYDNGTSFLERWKEHNISVGGQLSRTQGKTLHFNLKAETWLVGEDAGQLKLDFKTDLNFPLFGDTVTLAAKAYFHRLNPVFYERHFHSKHLWWDNDLSKTTRTKIEGLFAYQKTKTELRVAVEEIQNYTYLAMNYDYSNTSRTALSGSLQQNTGNISVITAQLKQPLSVGPLHWDNIFTFQSSSNKEVLPLPTFNVFSNLYLLFKVAKVLRVELGGAATWFTKYEAPDYLPQIGQFAVQQNANSKVSLGNFPFIDVYANLHLKHARFFVMMSNATGTSFNRMAFLTPHHPTNRSVLHLGVSWNFFN